MATVSEAPERVETIADLVERLGDIPLDRIRLKPAPGTAIERDVIAALEAPRKRLCELVDGVLVEKPVGTKEAILAGVIIHHLWTFVTPRDLGIVVGADGPWRLKLGLVRMPDVAFISWDRLPGEEFPHAAIARVIPNLAVEVLSPSNTKKEMERKLQDYFRAGVELVWIIDPKTQTAESYTTPTRSRKVAKGESLSGGKVLPGFTLSLKEVFGALRRKKR
jgi:Uma2 family endonuclease